MKFRLVIDQPLRPRGVISLADVHALRRHLHPQMKNLWKYPPLVACKDWIRKAPTNVGDIAILEDLNGREFVPLITQRAALTCSLDILFLRVEAPGSLVYGNGDIDNRLKTLLDALSCPPVGQIRDLLPPQADEEPMYCLLQDDRLITGMSVDTDRLLTSTQQGDSRAIVTVTIKGSKLTWGNMSLLAP